MFKKIRLLFIFGLLITINVGLFIDVKSITNDIEDDTQDIEIANTGSSALDWTMTEVVGDQSVSFSSYAGKIIILDFFAIYYETYGLVIGELSIVRSTYSTSQVAIFSIDFDTVADDAIELKEYVLAATGINWFYFMDTADVADYYGVTQIPSLIIIDHEGKVGFTRVGLIDAQHISDEVDALLDEIPTGTPSGPGEMSEWWKNNWYWFLVGGVLFVFVTGMTIYRRRIVVHNRKIREEKQARKDRNLRKRNR